MIHLTKSLLCVRMTFKMDAVSKYKNKLYAGLDAQTKAKDSGKTSRKVINILTSCLYFPIFFLSVSFIFYRN